MALRPGRFRSGAYRRDAISMGATFNLYLRIRTVLGRLSILQRKFSTYRGLVYLVSCCARAVDRVARQTPISHLELSIFAGDRCYHWSGMGDH